MVASQSDSVKVILDESYVEVPEPGEDEWESFQSVDFDSAALNGIHEAVSNLQNLMIASDFLLALILGVLLCQIFSRYLGNR